MKNKKERKISGDYTQLQTKILISTAAVLFAAFALIAVALRLLSGRFSQAVVGFLQLFYKDYDRALIAYTYVFRANRGMVCYGSCICGIFDCLTAVFERVYKIF